VPGITGRQEQVPARAQQRQPGQRAQQRQPGQQAQQRRRAQQRALQREQERGRALQQRALQQEQQLLLFGRKRSWKQPTEQPGEWNISFQISLKLRLITHTRDRSGTCDPADARILAKRQKKTTIR